MTGARVASLAPAFALAIAVAACGSRDAVGSDDAPTATPAAFAGFAGFDSISLVPEPDARRAGAAAGVFRFRVVDGALDWYVAADSLGAGRAYRVILSAADGREYAVASQRSRGDGTFAAHGVETVLMNRQCVGTEDPSRRPLAAAAPLRVSIKSDGSPAASATGNDVLGSRGSLPCSGNGDGVFEYLLHSTDQVSMAP